MSLKKKLAILGMSLGLLGLSANVNADDKKVPIKIKATKHSISFSQTQKYNESVKFNDKTYILETTATLTYWRNPECKKGEQPWYNGEHVVSTVSNQAKSYLLMFNDFDCDGQVDHIFSPILNMDYYREDTVKFKDKDEKEYIRRLTAFQFGDMNFKLQKDEFNKEGLLDAKVDSWLKQLKK
ncbi:MAG: hypothetical protein KKA65_04840 [Nanoarchaeota archaeon]|nr:hypothetical protein [Nanoarchaeota archaeon]MBU4242615.1 hypothetical protein [Nanoarchaeota archaeon]MBU4351659.1 hypothetical protein [Nanoarchaeota archaeon]MBU4456803.1 hypothetical protein [Nanoarchaeota archaeon]